MRELLDRVGRIELAVLAHDDLLECLTGTRGLVAVHQVDRPVLSPNLPPVGDPPGEDVAQLLLGQRRHGIRGVHDHRDPVVGDRDRDERAHEAVDDLNRSRGQRHEGRT